MGFAPIAAGVAVAQMGIGIATQIGAQQAAHDRFRSFRKSAVNSAIVQGTGIRTKTAQERVQIVEEVSNIISEGIKVRGASAAKLASRNVSGRAVADVQMDHLRAETSVRNRLGVLQRFREDAAEQEIMNLAFTTRNRILGGGGGGQSQNAIVANQVFEGVNTGLATFTTLQSLNG